MERRRIAVTQDANGRPLQWSCTIYDADHVPLVAVVVPCAELMDLQDAVLTAVDWAHRWGLQEQRRLPFPS